MSTTINFGCHHPKRKLFFHPCIKKDISNETYLFRGDLPWSFFATTINERFAGTPQIYQGACSEGSEAYSLKLIWDKVTGGRKIKINAFDIMPKIIRRAQSGIIELHERSFFNLDLVIPPEELMQSFTKIPNTHREVPGEYKADSFRVADRLREGLSFQVGDAVEFSSKKQKDPCVFMFRNVMPYLRKESYDTILSNMENNFQPGSIVATGFFDEHVQATKKILERGFESLERYIFLKK